MQTCLDLQEHIGGVYPRSWALFFPVRSGYYKIILKGGGTEVVFSAWVQNQCVPQWCSMTDVAVTDIADRIHGKRKKMRRTWRLHFSQSTLAVFNSKYSSQNELLIRIETITLLRILWFWSSFLHFVDREFKSLVISLEFNSESDTVMTLLGSRDFYLKLCRSKWWLILLDCKLPL